MKRLEMTRTIQVNLGGQDNTGTVGMYERGMLMMVTNTTGTGMG